MYTCLVTASFCPKSQLVDVSLLWTVTKGPRVHDSRLLIRVVSRAMCFWILPAKAFVQAIRNGAEVFQQVEEPAVPKRKVLL